MIQGKMVGWHYQLNGHEFVKTPGDSEGQGNQAGCSPCLAKYWSFSISPSNEYSGLISFRADWFDLAVQGNEPGLSK